MKTLLLLIVFAASSASLQARIASFHYVAVVFRDNDPKTVAEGDLNATTYKRWFATPYTVGGLRAEIPPGSVSFGALFIYSRGTVLTMPFYQFNGAFACQGHMAAEPPEFMVIEPTQTGFVAALKKRLAELH